MVAIADKVASKLEEKKGSITEDEVTKYFQLIYVHRSPIFCQHKIVIG